MPARSLSEILQYAERLAAIDKTRTEEIPVNIDEAYEVQAAVAKEKGFAGTMSVFDLELYGRRLRIL
jgi:hypothetical protein